MGRKLLFSVLLIFVLNSVFAQVDVQWITRYTSTGNFPDRAKNMVTDPAGNVYVTGIGMGPTNFDFVTVKYNNFGVQQWVVMYNGTGNALDEARAVAVDGSGNVYVTGWSAGPASNYDIVTIKYNSAGVQQWASRFDGLAGANDEPWGIGLDPAGNVYVTGDTDGGGAGGVNYVTLKYNNAGVQQWATSYNGPGNNIDIAYAIAVDAAGNSYVTGASTGTTSGFDYATVKYNTAGVQQWVRIFDGTASKDDTAFDLKIDGSGNVYITGEQAVSTINLSEFQYCTIKYDNAGTLLWNRVYHGTATNHDRGNAVAVDGNGNVFVTGKAINTGTAEDIVTIKYTSSGVQRWVRIYDAGIGNYDEGKAIAVDATGSSYVTGYSYFTASNNDYVTMKFDSLGVRQWLTKYNGPGNNSDQAIKIALDAGNNAYITGTSRGAGTNEDFATIKYCQLAAEAGPDVAICLGGSTQLNASAPGAISFSWTPAAGLTSTTIANPVANPTSTTIYIVAITNASGCVDLDSVIVTVNPLPGPNITSNGPTTFCAGGSVILSSASATTYSWLPGGQTTQSITVTTSGTYTCRITNSSSCAAQSTKVVTVNPLPNVVAGPNDTICRTKTVCLNATGAVTYAWSPNTAISDTTIANPCVAPLNTITYTVLGRDANGCKKKDSLKVVVLPNPAAPPITQQFDSLFTTVTGVTYQWFISPANTPVAGATNKVFRPTANGSYYLRITNSTGCSSFSSIIVVTNVGIQELTGVQNVLIYPNPGNGFFNLVLDMNSPGDLMLTVFSLTGQEIFSEIVRAQTGTTRKQIDLSSAAHGMYIMQIRSAQGSYFSRLEIQ